MGAMWGGRRTDVPLPAEAVVVQTKRNIQNMNGAEKESALASPYFRRCPPPSVPGSAVRIYRKDVKENAPRQLRFRLQLRRGL